MLFLKEIRYLNFDFSFRKKKYVFDFGRFRIFPKENIIKQSQNHTKLKSFQTFIDLSTERSGPVLRSERTTEASSTTCLNLTKYNKQNLIYKANSRRKKTQNCYGCNNHFENLIFFLEIFFCRIYH